MAGTRVFFITNRNHLPTDKRAHFGPQFNANGVAGLRFGHADVAPKGAPQVEVYPERLAEDGFCYEVKGSSPFLGGLRDRMAAGCSNTLVFIHGFNVSFVEALRSAALLADHVSIDGEPLNVVLFSWPSDGKLVPYMSYYSDREDARVSGPALARAYLMLYDFLETLKDTDYCNQSLHVLAHSMGNYVLRHGLQALIAKQPRRLVRLFSEIVMAAPDEDDDAFEREDKLAKLPNICRRITIYHNRNDRALIVSDRTKAQPDRLGSDGPRLMDMLPKKVVSIDCSRVAKSTSDRVIGHSYVWACEPVRNDLLATLRGTPGDLIHSRQSVRSERSYRLIE